MCNLSSQSGIQTTPLVMEVQSPRHWTSRKFPGNEWRFKHKRPFLSSRILQRRRLTSKWVLYLLVMSIKTGVLGSCVEGYQNSLGQRVSSSGSWWLSWVWRPGQREEAFHPDGTLKWTMWRGWAWRPRIWSNMKGLVCCLSSGLALYSSNNSGGPWNAFP